MAADEVADFAEGSSEPWAGALRPGGTVGDRR
jgi:hypothetical protein